jgi:hypothetical protein
VAPSPIENSYGRQDYIDGGPGRCRHAQAPSRTTQFQRRIRRYRGIFTAYVTENFITLGAALVFGTQGVVGKLIALPEFVLVVALARAIGSVLRRRGLEALLILLVLKVTRLRALFALAVAFRGCAMNERARSGVRIMDGHDCDLCGADAPRRSSSEARFIS